MQFDNKVVYDMHWSLLHKEVKNEKSQNEPIKKEPQFADQSNILQSNENTGSSQKSTAELNSSLMKVGSYKYANSVIKFFPESQA